LQSGKPIPSDGSIQCQMIPTGDISCCLEEVQMYKFSTTGGS
jgi:hypothetical protein